MLAGMVNCLIKVVSLTKCLTHRGYLYELLLGTDYVEDFYTAGEAEAIDAISPMIA